MADDQDGASPSIVTPNNPLSTDRFGWQMARGLVPDSELFVAYGRSVATGATTDKVLWSNGVFSLPAATGVQMSLVSTDAEDDKDAGTGLRSVFVLYLDADLNVGYEIVELEGLTPVTTTATNIRFIQDMIAVTFGSTGASVGTITASNGGTVYSEINPLNVRSLSSARMVPAGYTAYIAGASISSVSGAAAAAAQVSFAATELYGFSFLDPFNLIPLAGLGVEDGSITYEFPILIKVNEGHVFTAIYSVDKAATVTAAWYGWLEKNT